MHGGRNADTPQIVLPGALEERQCHLQRAARRDQRTVRVGRTRGQRQVSRHRRIPLLVHRQGAQTAAPLCCGQQPCRTRRRRVCWRSCAIASAAPTTCSSGATLRSALPSWHSPRRASRSSRSCCPASRTSWETRTSLPASMQCCKRPRSLPSPSKSRRCRSSSSSSRNSTPRFVPTPHSHAVTPAAGRGRQ